jgi:hypothetical protein
MAAIADLFWMSPDTSSATAGHRPSRMSDTPPITVDTLAGWMMVIFQLVAENRRLRDRIADLERAR